MSKYSYKNTWDPLWKRNLIYCAFGLWCLYQAFTAKYVNPLVIFVFFSLCESTVSLWAYEALGHQPGLQERTGLTGGGLGRNPEFNPPTFCKPHLLHPLLFQGSRAGKAANYAVWPDCVVNLLGGWMSTESSVKTLGPIQFCTNIFKSKSGIHYQLLLLFSIVVLANNHFPSFCI